MKKLIQKESSSDYTLNLSDKMEGVISLYFGASTRSLSLVPWSNKTMLFTFSFCFPLLHFCIYHQIVLVFKAKHTLPIPTIYNLNHHTKFKIEKIKFWIQKHYQTFFFCFPPPDLAGFEDGGGAFSFLGAY